VKRELEKKRKEFFKKLTKQDWQEIKKLVKKINEFKKKVD